ncbi:MAG: thioesterase II family protein [Leptolyngbyaceae cyanobacterium MO_188.B28]|nr:thioesterase II family protein [Leptolyngbyaceae cyanobacterium MO_188.B28]
MKSSLQIRDRWIKCITPNPNACLRLFCFHYAGGNTSVFRDWANQVLDSVEVYAIELPGRGTRLTEPAFTHMAPLIQALKNILAPYLTQPFAFFGHSMGALVSYELSQSLQQEQGLTPTHLFVSGHRAPHLPDLEEPIHALPTADFLEALRRYNGTPEVILQNAELMELLLPTLRADFTLLEAYVYRPRLPLGCPISAYGGLQDWKVSEDELESWGEHTQADFSHQLFEGDHFFIHSAQSSLLLALNTTLKNLVKV